MPHPTKLPATEHSALPTQIFLGSATCGELWDNMSQVIVPSWVGSVPSHVGNGQHKKLSADQWRVLGLIYLVLTLIPMWTDRGGIFIQLLENYMDLVETIRLATSHSVSEESIQAYETAIHKYLQGMGLLFPGAAYTPTQHAATHFGTLLRNFGPSKDWNCFAFERMNHKCQECNTNKRPGKAPFGNNHSAHLHRAYLIQAKWREQCCKL